MLFDQAALNGIAAGTTTLAFRRWERARAKPGGQQRTGIGVVQIDAVTPVDDISEQDARHAGYACRAELLAVLQARSDRPLWRISLHLAGPDPRVALRNADRLTPGDIVSIEARLRRWDQASSHGPWTAATLRLIRDRPGVRAADLAASLGRDTQPFKLDVRKLKELGLTESLEVGYRLAPRGRAFVER